MKSKYRIKLDINDLNFDSKEAIIPEVDGNKIIPKIKIYDACNDNSYYYRAIGFNRRITDEDR